jgi:6-pyruvoyl-tetrahydropterin synthase
MSLDFGDLKRIMKELDHKILVVENDRQFCDPEQFNPAGVVILPGKGPSVENVADYCLSRIEAVIRGKYPDRSIAYHVQVTIEETDHNFFISQRDLVI